MATASKPSAATDTALADAYYTLKTSKEAPGKKEQAFDRLGNAIASVGESPTLTFLNNFYTANSAVLGSAAAGLASLDNKTIDTAITGFSESVKVVMNGLDALGQVHPFVGVAVVAFKLVVTLDLTRRQNNQKVMAVKIQMQQMMCTLFQLRRIRDPEEVGPDGTILRDRMQPLMEQIAQGIKECGSACDVYLKKSFIAKTLKSKFYEVRLAEYVTKFIDYADKLDKALTVHIALGVDAANEKLDGQSAKLDSIKQKLDVLFRKLDTPREREVMEFIEENGGSKAVLERNDLVEKLVIKSGETIADLADKSLTSKSDLDSVKEKLRKEFSEDLDTVLQRNFTLFDRKLEIQSRNIADALDKQGQYIVSALSQGTHDKIKDTDLSNLWKEMGWKGSVKARHFVLALRDYFTEQFMTGTPLPRAGEFFAVAVSPSDDLLTPLEPPADFVIPHLPGLNDDKWALDFINVAHLQAILEAIDDDGTGFISIKEANTFAIERPKGWSLLHWIAFWAKGWEMSLADYENKIFLILREMDSLHHQVLKENRYHVDSYLRNYSICGIELLLRSTKTSKDYTQICHELSCLTEAYALTEEERLRLNLENIGYDMDSAATVTLITGPGRIERFLFPLLYLMLKRHLEVFHYACNHVVDSEEFSHMSITLGSIFDVVEQRVDSLGAIYKQVHIDLNTHLENFALGMFHDFSAHNYAYGNRESLILGWQDTSKTKNESDETTMCDDPENAKPIFHLDHESTDNYRGVWQNWPAHSFETDDPRTGNIYGFWTGAFLSIKGKSVISVLGLTQLCLELDPDDDSLLKGFAVTFSGRLELCGRRRKVEATDENAAFEQIDVLMWFDDGYTVRFCGKFDVGDESLSGDWSTFNEKEDAKTVYDENPFSVSPPAREDEGGEAQQDDVGSQELSRDAGSPGGDEDEKEGGISSPETDRKDEVNSTSEVQAVTDAVDDQASKSDTEDIANDARAEQTGEPVDGEEGGGASPVDDTTDDIPIIETFIFRRTPVEIFHFRSLLREEENQAKARWNFLRDSVLHLVRRRLWSWKHIKAWGDDRRKFFDFYEHNWLLNTCNFVTPNPITSEDILAWRDLKYRLPPGLIRLCVEALNWSLYRLPFHYGINCDGCSYRIIDARFVCLTCMDPEMSNSFDLCSQCMDKPAERSDFQHTPEHTLIKCPRYVHKYFQPWLINEARLMATRLKTTFTEIMANETDGIHGGERHYIAKAGHSELLCACCTKPVRVPCWICITCSPETYICEECEGKELPVLKDGPGSPTHRVDHHLLRIHNLEPDRFEREKLEQTIVRINALETAVNDRFEALASTVETHITALESKVEARLASFDSILRRIALQLNVPELEPEAEAPTKDVTVTGKET